MIAQNHLSQPVLEVCHNCGTPLSTKRVRACQAQGSDPCCQECEQAWEEDCLIREEREQAYRDARVQRVLDQRREREEWRLQRFLQRLAEQEETRRRVDQYREECL